MIKHYPAALLTYRHSNASRRVPQMLLYSLRVIVGRECQPTEAAAAR
jgi:hypothetical protein